MEGPGNFDYVLEEMTDYMPWDYENSHIEKLISLKVTSQAIFVAMRTGGYIDFYINFDRISSFKQEEVTDIDYDARYIFFKMRDEKVKKLPASLNLKMNWAYVEDCESSFKWEDIKLTKLENYFNPFTSMTFISDSVFISHGSFLSQYNIVKGCFLAHFMFPEPVLTSFKFTEDDDKYSCYVITERGKIFTNIKEYKEAESIIHKDDQSVKLSKEMMVESFALDRQRSKYFLFSGSQGFYILYKN